MTQIKNWQTIYALSLALIVSSAWAEEKKPVAGKPAACPKCCKTAQAPTSSECCNECPSSCNSPSSSKLVTRIHPLGAFFEAMEQMEEEETPVSAQPPWAERSGKRNVEEQIIKLITNHIQPASWTSMGGRGTVDYFPLGRALIISQKAETQEQIARFLEDLRALVDSEACEEEEAAQQCLPPPAMVGMPMPMYCCPGPLDMPIERIMIERLLTQPAYSYAPVQAMCPVPPPMPAAPVPPPPVTPMTDALQARRPPAEVLPVPHPVTSMPAVAPCVAVQPAPSQSIGCMMRAKREGGKTQLEMENCCMGMRAVCESMELKTSASESLKLTAQQGQIHIDGHGFRAMADSLRCTGGTDWMLEGHVMLTYKKDGTSAQVRGDRLMVSLKEGQMEFKLTGSTPSMPSPIQPVMYLRSPN